jgi:signal peptidase I
MNRDKALQQTVLAAWKKGGRERSVKITGSSMQPLIKEGDTITFVPLRNADSLKTGDIAVFQRGTGLIAHRIIGKSIAAGTVYFTERGDNMFSPAPVPAHDIIGRVTKIESGRSVVHLDVWYWSIMNRALGYYWKTVFIALERIPAVKKKLLGSIKAPHISALYSKIVRFLVRLPQRVLRFK